ncbi:anion transporter [Marinitoga arctica]
MINIITFIKNEFVFFIFLFLLLILSILYPQKMTNYIYFVDWKTIIILTGLIIITSGIKESGYLFSLAKKLLPLFNAEKSLALFLIMVSIILSTFLTNDITLFIVIPLTFSIKKLIKNDISKFIIFETIAVNIGSSLTPIGNPQNLFLWNKWNIPFYLFILKMLPLFIIFLLTILLFSLFLFPNKEIVFLENINKNIILKKWLFIISIFFLFLYIISIEKNNLYFAITVIFIFYSLFYRDILLKTDWFLILLFIIILIDFHIISSIPFIDKMVNLINLQSRKNVFLFSLILSQIISNVPASVFISKFSNNWLTIAYGTNIGGNGIVIGSLANIIALRLSKEKKIWINLHKYSLLYLLITTIITFIFVM